ncbi:MAG: flippase-like domain-containing protein [Bacteroidaceae bacterium]|nr:flippase-like domain-containing protein [Bacteroidaceae bacterium]
MQQRARNILFFIGLASVILMLLLFDVSWQTLWQDICHAGYWLVAIGVLWLVLYVMNALTWYVLLRESGSVTLSFLRLLKITVSAFALNSATPIGLLGGEPYKIIELTPHVGVQRATSSVVLFAMMHIFAHFCYWVTGIVLYVVLLPVDTGMGVVLAAAALFCGTGIYLFLKGYRHGLVVRGIRWLGHIPGLRSWAHRFAASHEEDLHRIDAQIAELHRQSRRTFYASLALEYVGRMMQSLEIMFMLLLFGAECSWMTFVQSVLILSFTSLFANLLGFIPLQLGGREGGFALSTAQLGLTGGTGLFISIICRVRELFFTCIGLALMKVGNVNVHADNHENGHEDESRKVRS